MSDPFHPDTWRDTLISIVEIGGIVVVMGAAAVCSLRKAFRFTDAFENEVAKPSPRRDEGGTCFPETRKQPDPGEKPPDPGPGPTIRANRIS